jgi:hypothetical protein
LAVSQALAGDGAPTLLDEPVSFIAGKLKYRTPDPSARRAFGLHVAIYS